MLKKSLFPHMMNLIVTLIMVSIMAIAMSFINTGAIVFIALLKEIAIGTLLGFVLLEMIPIGKLAFNFSTITCKQKPQSFGFILADNLIRTIFMTLVMNTLFTFMAIGYPPFFWQAWLGGIVPGFIIGYLAGLLAGAIGEKICHKICIK